MFCPYCKTNVAVSLTGKCAICRQVIRDTEGKTLTVELPDALNADRAERDVETSARTTVDVEDRTRHEHKRSPNPYQSPTSQPEKFTAIRHKNIRQHPFLWLLFSFEGRIPRRVFWAGIVLVSVGFFLLALGQIVFLEPLVGPKSFISTMLNLLSGGLQIWIGLALVVKRWHDRGKSGVWFLIIFVPIVGQIWHFVETGFLRGTAFENRYGADPTFNWQA